MIDLTMDEIADIMSILEANTAEELIKKLDDLKEYILNNSKKHYTARVTQPGTKIRKILTKHGTLVLEDYFYEVGNKRITYYFDSIEDVISLLNRIDFLIHHGVMTIEIWVTTDAGTDKLLFKII